MGACVGSAASWFAPTCMWMGERACARGRCAAVLQETLWHGRTTVTCTRQQSALGSAAFLRTLGGLLMFSRLSSPLQVRGGTDNTQPVAALGRGSCPLLFVTGFSRLVFVEKLMTKVAKGS